MSAPTILATAEGFVVALALALPAHAQAPQTVVVTTDHRRCVDCSLPEAAQPHSFATESLFSKRQGAFALRFSRLTWRAWGAARTAGQGRVRLGYLEDPWRPARVRLVLTGRRPHTPDGCGHTSAERIYTRALITVIRPRTFRGRYTVRLPATGCETA